MAYTDIVFDIDGTLIDTEHTVLYSFRDTLKTVTGRDYDINDLYFALGITGHDALRKLNIDNVAEVDKLWNENMHKYRDKVVIFEGILSVLERLISSNYNLGIVTSQTEKEMEDDFNRLGLKKYFKTIINADSTKNHKPSADPLLKYMELAKSEKKNTIYIGDSEYDMLCAKNAGVDSALALWGAYSKEPLKATHYFKKPEDLFKIL